MLLSLIKKDLPKWEVLHMIIGWAYFLIRSKRIFRASEKKNLASTAMINRSAKIKKVTLTNSIPLKFNPANPIRPVATVIIRKGIIYFSIVLVFIQRYLNLCRTFIKKITIDSFLTEEINYSQILLRNSLEF